MSSTITDHLATTMEGPLARLVAFEPTTLPVLSVYLNTQPDQHGRTTDALPYLHREFKALARTWAPSSAERHSFDRDVERILAYTTGTIDPAANGVAMFACWGAGEFFEAIQLTTPVGETCVYANSQPHLYRLAHLDEQYPRYADELLISGALEDSHPLPEEVRAILAPELPDSEGGTASEEPRQASLPDLLVTKAKQSGATVTFIEDAALLESVGGVAAFLRWRG